MKKRKRADITRRELAWTVAGVFAIGGVFGWAAFGGLPFPVKALKESSLAEWLGAVGTWIIGYGAWKYARANLEHLVEERDALLENTKQATRSRLSQMITTATKGRAPAAIVGAFLSQPEARRTVNALSEALEIAAISTRSIDWSEADRECVTDAVIVPFARFDLALGFYAERSRRLLMQLRRHNQGPISRGQTLYLDHLQKLANDLNNRASTLIDALSERRN